MKRMSSRDFNTLIRRLLKANYAVSKPYRRGRRGMSDWVISRYNYRTRRQVSKVCPTQEDFIRMTRYLLDGGPKPHKVVR